MHASIASRWRRAVASLAVFASACGAEGPVPSPRESAPPREGLRQRVQASGDAARALIAGGASVVADYGSFQILDAPPAAVGALPPGAQVEDRSAHHRIFLNSGELDTSRPEMTARAPLVAAGERALHLVQFAGPVRLAWRERLERQGARVVAYIPSNAYLVYGDERSLRGVHGLALAGAEVKWAGPYQARHKVHPAVATVESGAYAVQLVEDPIANALTLALARQSAQREVRVSRALGYVNLVLYVEPGTIDELARRPDVVSIQPWTEPRLRDERQDMILAGQLVGSEPAGPGYLAWLAEKGFTQEQFDLSGFGVDVSDSGIDNGTVDPNHFGLHRLGDVSGSSRVVYARLEGTPSYSSTIQGCDGHGNINAHIVAGYSDLTGVPFADAEGYRYGLGVAPFVRVGSSVVFDPSFTLPDFEDLQSRAWGDGMRVSTNSWGQTYPTGAYTSDSQRYDALVRDAAPTGSAAAQPGNQEMVIVFAAGNSGPYAQSVGAPGTAKNVLTVGASENVQAFGGPDGCGAWDADADLAMDVAFFSSRGPTQDGRAKPDLVAPGTHVSGGVAQSSSQHASPPASATGAALACFLSAADGVCGGTGSSPFHPAGQQWYTASSGTSHATPAVAGAAALLRQYFINGGRPPPSPSMTKAFLMNAARYMTGAGAGGDLHSNAQGMGLLDLGAALDGAGRILRDQDLTDLFTAPGQTRTFSGSVLDATRPFRVTLAWTDAPGSTAGAAYNNDLDLTVAVGGVTYRGNVFSGQTSIAGGTADDRNNVESVFLPAGTSGSFTVTVTAASINSDGVPGNGTALDQDFALVITNTCDTLPPAPAGVTAAATGQNQITVSWEANGATSYNVYRALAAGGPYARLASVAAPPYLDSTASGGTTYHFVVRAQNCAESVPSAEASAVATGACLLPPTFTGLQSADTTGALVCGNALTWAAATPSCGGTIAYDVFRGTEPFTPGSANRIATGVTALTYADSGDLVAGTTYHYVVRAVETSPGGAVSDGNAVERTAAPSRRVFADDFDAHRPDGASAWWIERALSGPDALSLVSGCRWQSATTAYRFGAAADSCGGTYSSNAQSLLLLGGDGSIDPGVNGLGVPEGGATLTFRLWYQLESGYDGAYLVYSTSGAAGSFVHVPDSPTLDGPYITSGGYDGTPIATDGHRAWAGSSLSPNGALELVTVNLDALAGQTVWFGWRFGTDSIIGYEGLYLDDVALSVGACFTTPPAAGDAVSYRVTGLPGTVVADEPVLLTITALDAYGEVATGYSGTASLASSDPAAVLPPTASLAGGVATATVRLRRAGAQTVTATDVANASRRAGAGTTVVAGAAVALTFVSQPSSATAGWPISVYPYVRVAIRDAFGNTTNSNVNVTVSLADNPGNAMLDGQTNASAFDGEAIFWSLYVTRAATGYTLRASSPGLAAATSASFDITPTYPSRLAFAERPRDVVAGEAITPGVRVTAADPYDNPTQGWGNVTVSILNGSGGALYGVTSVALTGGGASFDDLYLEKSGQGHQLFAQSDQGYAAAVSEPFTVTHAPADRVVMTRQPTDVDAGMPFEHPVAARLIDRFGNDAVSATSLLSLSLASNPGGGSLRGTTTVAAAAGQASFPDVTIDRAGRGYMLGIGGAGLQEATTVGFEVRLGPAATYEITGASTAVLGVETPLTAIARDLGGNAVPSHAEVAFVTSSDPAALLPGLVSFTAGVATFPVTFHTAGTHTVTLATGPVVIPGVRGSRSIAVSPPSDAPAPDPGLRPTPEPGGKGGCTSGSAGAAEALALAVLALLRPAFLRRRRPSRA